MVSQEDQQTPSDYQNDRNSGRSDQSISYLTDRPEERAIEDVLREEGVSYTSPRELGDPYHDKGPDFYYHIEGIGRRGLEIKNRQPDSVQDEREVRRDFIKESKSPADYWGSFQLTNDAIVAIMDKDPIGTVVHEPTGFKYEKDPEDWKRAFREFIREKKKLGALLDLNLFRQVESPVRASTS